MRDNRALAKLDRVLGTWHVTGTHPALPGRTLRGVVTFERVEGGAFLRMQSRMEDPEIPDGVAIVGTDGGTESGTMIYFDVRGVARCYDVAIDADGFVWTRDAADLSQRFRVALADDGETMQGEGTMKKHGSEAWEPDLRLTYARTVR